MTAQAGAVERLLALLPVHHLTRDARTDGLPGPLESLLTAVATELEVLEEDARRLYEAWFIETCEEWLVPYLADLVGLAEVPPEMGTTVSRRALVANTVAYRRRKGTLAVVEQVARDVTGWPTRAVEYHPLLVATTHVNHVRLDRLAVTGLRLAAPHDLAAVTSPPSGRRALDPRAHTVEVRRIASGRGRYGIRNIGVFPFAAQTAVIGAPGDEVPPAHGAEDGWSRTRVTGGWQAVDPLGRATPLFAPPAAETAIEALAGEPDLPVPLRPRRLLEMLRAARAGEIDARDLPLGIRIGTTGTELAPERIRVCELEDLAPGDAPQMMVDAVGGRLRAYHHGAAYVPATVFVRYAYGTPADVGAGPYDRSQRHEDLLATDTWDAPVQGAGSGPGPADLQVAVSSAPSASPTTAAEVVAALASVAAAWASPTGRAKGATATVSIEDSNRYAGDPAIGGDLAVEVPTGTRLVLVAARWPARVLPNGDVQAPVPGRYTPDGLRPHVQATLRITGEAGASVVVDGLLIEGDLVIEAGHLGSLTLAHSTVTGTVRVGSAGSSTNDALSVRLERSIVGAIDAAPTVPLVGVVDSVIDPQALPAGTAALRAPGAQLSLAGSTVRGGLEARTLDATSCLLDGRVQVAHRQVGCVRFSYVGPGSRTPRRYRCAPADGGDGPPAPVYVSTDPASPAYLVLAATCPPEIATGGERESEMGVGHHLFRPLRKRAAARQLAPYLPVGSQLGILGS